MPTQYLFAVLPVALTTTRTRTSKSGVKDNLCGYSFGALRPAAFRRSPRRPRKLFGNGAACRPRAA
jgi:hypothetical protein